MSDEAGTEAANGKSMIKMTTQVVAAYLSNNSVAPNQITEVINTVHDALNNLNEVGIEPESEPTKPAVPVKKSVTPDHIICLEDGKQLKMLKRHLRTTYNMTPEDYRAKWGLPAYYPMVAPNYATQRSEFAKKIGLGRQTSRRGGRRKGV
ncbi:ROS/MUCR transcriptional regulator family protein [Candidatus Endolissoclinum faulkneri L2]|uniref:ROS/MUCR transcriptional regulator family protein n=1 Tax=Candidatus Endolissoclinum faulkneri L2 TaxID=1193729 RepID=K7YNE2_9PROT|nr:MucR family transcriptional regulator [Candidatus Endolissoclinum faulkneri]AFX99022.1 ROS/MUCR transcriptional regulator family protein [Candidatus Endolissoclinum faulkneri L2]